jgi:protease IV
VKGSNFKLLSNILRGAWYMHPDKAFAQMPLVEKLISGEMVFEEDATKPPTMGVMSFKGGKAAFQNSLDDAPENSIALIRVRGSLMKEDYCGDPGMASMGKMIMQADAHQNVKGTVLVIDSPGGTVDGTEEFARLIRSTKKPIVSFVDGIAASAAYWTASSTDHIMLSGETAEVGSIGTMVGFRDYSKAMEERGIKEHFIFATKSTEKWASYLEALDGKYDKMKAQELDPLNEVFLSSVKSKRPELSEEQMKGTVYFGSNAVKLNLADSIGTLEDAVAKVIELAHPTQDATDDEANQLEQNLNINSEEEMKFISSKLDKAVAKLAASFKAGEDISAEDINPVIEQLTAAGLEGFVMDTEEGRNALTEANTTLTAKVAELEGKLATATTELKDANTEVERLGGLAGAAHTEAAKPDGDKGAGGGETRVISETEAELNARLEQEKEEEK